MERLSQAVSAPPSEVDPLESLAPFEGGPASKAVPALNHLVKAVREAATDAERRDFCGQINKVLEAMQQPNETQARSLVGWLDEEAFHGLVDGESMPCRAVAVGALLRMGYPYALEVDPDDLEFFRLHQSSGVATGTTLFARVLAGLAATSYGAVAGLLLSSASFDLDSRGLDLTVLALLAGTSVAALSGLVMAWAPKVRWLSLAARVLGPLAAVSLAAIIGPGLLLVALEKFVGQAYVLVAMTAAIIGAAVSPRTKE